MLPSPVPPSLVLRGALVVDGTGRARHRADVAVEGGRITAILPETGHPSRSHRAGGARVVDADGLVLAPGFIDMHAHSDLALLSEPAHEAKVTQGVTTEVLGQDGLSYAPVTPAVLGPLRRQLAGWNGDPPGVDVGWASVADYLDTLDASRIAVNAAYLVPQGVLRAVVVGWDDVPATADQVAAMQQVLAAGLADGAVGMSSGLTYTPGMYADTDELVALGRTVAAHGGFYAPHHRSYGRGALAAYAEMIEVARRSGCALHLAHATLNFPCNAGRAPELLAMVDAALAEGIDVTLDTYPYLPGATTLAAMLPSWASAGGPDATLHRLAHPPTRDRIRHDLEVTGSDGAHGEVVDWDTIEISGVRRPELAGLVGLTVDAIARRGLAPRSAATGGARGAGGAGAPQAPFDVFADLLVADDLGTAILQHVGNEENVRAIMAHRVHTAGSDGLLAPAKPHPRAWGTFARYLGHYTRELGVLSLEECVAHLTGRAARRLRLRDRGLVRVGYAADLVLFDPATVADTATFAEPRQRAAGIPYVFVNGRPVVDDGRPTGARPGRSLRRRADGTVAAVD